jgi:hypothetical protein
MAIGCPDPRQLVRLGTPAVGDATSELYDEHVTGCPTCQAVLRRFVDGGLESAALSLSKIAVPGDLARIPGFTIERELGRGAMGVVYLATQDEIGRLVALKLVAGGHAAGDGERRRWLREAKAASQVRHPNIVTFYDFGEAAPWSYLVLEFVSGGTLKSRLSGPLPPRDAARLLETVARAVHQIHGHRIYHLDLKPSNILLEGDENTPWDGVIPKVSDFGIARLVGDATASLSSGGPIGTPAYMSPEQAGRSNGPIGPEADVYALGAILYELLTGRPPIQRISIFETLEAIRTQEPISPRRINPAISRDLETICLKCLQKSPARRYASAEVLADDLHRWLDGRPIAARPVSFPESTWRACRRRPAVAALALSLAMSLAAGFLGMFLLWRHAEAQRSRAEADYRTAIELVDQNVALTAGGDYISKADHQKNFIETLEKTRAGLLKVAASRPDQAEIYRFLGFVDQRLGHVLLLNRRWDEAHSVLEESLRAYDRAIIHNPHDADDRISRVYTLLHLRSVEEHKGKLEECVRLSELAVVASETLMKSELYQQSIRTLACSRNQLTLVLEARGNQEAARALMAANARLLEKVTVDAVDPEIMAWRVFARYGVDCLGAGAGQVRGTGRSDADRKSTETWAERAADGLHLACTPKTTCLQESAAGFEFVLEMAEIASRQRQSGRLDDARHTADRIHAFANQLRNRYPDQSYAHLALGEAFSQLQKNAWKMEDRASVESNLKLALEAAERALALDPKNEKARIEAEHRRGKLRDLMASR